MIIRLLRNAYKFDTLKCFRPSTGVDDMGLREQVNTTLRQAMKSKDATRLSTLRLINAAIKDHDIAARGGVAGDGGVSDKEILDILGKMTRQRHESARIYEEGGRLELAERERMEIAIIAEFLPRQLDETEILEAVELTIKQTNASSIRDMGKIMGLLKVKYTGQMDFGVVGSIVKKKLT